MLRKKWIRVGYFCTGALLIIVFVISEGSLIRSRQLLPSGDIDSYVHNELYSTEKSSKVYNSQANKRVVQSKKSSIGAKVLISAQNDTKKVVANKASVISDKAEALSTNFTGPFSVNDTNPPLDVQLLHLPHNLSALCDSKKKLLVVVISSASELAQRAAIRKTWATDASHKTSVIFHIGLERTSSHNATANNFAEDIIQERLQYGDMVVSNVVEDYYNLTLKTYATMKFLSSHCHHAKCVLKCDSDTVVNLPAIEKLCNETFDSPSILGQCNVGEPERYPSSKWFTPTWVWPGQYPKFCLGNAFMLVGSNTSKKLLDHLNETAFFRSGNLRKMGEDVVWTGIVAEKANISRTGITGFSPQKNMIYHCFPDGLKASLTVHYVKGLYDMEKYWKFMRSPNTCEKTETPSTQRSSNHSRFGIHTVATLSTTTTTEPLKIH